METHVTIKPKILGFTDSRCECDRCGKTNLKGTYCIETPDQGLLYLGSTCISRLMEYSSKETTKFIKSEKELRRKQKQAEIKAATQHLEDQMQVMREEQAALPSTEQEYLLGIPSYRKLWNKITEIKAEIEKNYTL